MLLLGGQPRPRGRFVCLFVRPYVRMSQIPHLHGSARAYCTPGLVLFNIAILQIIQISSMSPLSSKFVLKLSFTLVKNVRSIF